MNKRFFLVILTVPTLVLIGLVLHRHSHPAVNSSNFDSAAVQIWEGLAFQNIKATPTFENQVKKIPLLLNCKISDAQRSDFYVSLYNAFIGLNDGSYESYRRFRTPTPAKLNPGFFNEANREKLINGAKALMHQGEQVPSDFEEYVRVMTARMNEGRGLTNYWVGVCLTNVSIVIEENTNLPPDLLTVATKKENAGLFRPIHFFVIDHDEKKVLSEDGKIISATLSAIISHNPPDPPYRVFIRYFWDDKYACWVPSEYVASLSAQRKWALIW